ncbi:unnamed protein product [Rodentolepis nana]|uniref:HCLS1-associated protein X-1 n=1 Tax=Rodentolepis nana TaxID=102285 RepID=A0A0R3T8T0_RODNA|nr:unnamed protein product [Rodentolepis nana]
MGFGFPERMFSDILQSFFDDLNDFRTPYRTYGGYFVPHNPRSDYVIDEDSIDQSQPSFPMSLTRSYHSSTSFSSTHAGNRFETVKTSIRQPDGIQILKEIIRQNGQETVTTKTTYPDGRVETTTETRGNALESNITPPAIMSTPQPTAQQYPQTGGFFSNIRRWFRSE